MESPQERIDAIIERSPITVKRQLYYFLFLSLIAFGLGVRHDIYNLPLMHDSQLFFYRAERFVSGISPYTSLFDENHALSSMLTGGAISIGSVVGIPDVVASRILSLSLLATSFGLTWLLAYRLTQNLKVSIFAVLSMLSFSPYIYKGAMGNSPKVFMVFFMLLTMLFFFQRKPFRAGLCASLSFLCWQPALLIIGSLVLVLARSPKRLYNISLALLGAIIPISIYEAYFIFTGSFWEQIEQVYYYPAKFSTNRFRGFKSSFFNLKLVWEKGFGKFNILPLVFLYSLIRYWFHLYRNRRSRFFFLELDSNWLFFHITMYGTLAFIYYDPPVVPDLFFTLPFVVIMCGWGLDRSINDIPNLKMGFRQIASVLSVFLLLVLIIISNFIRKFEPPPFTLSDQYQLAAVVRQFHEDNESLYVIGPTHLLAFNNYENWTMYGVFFNIVDDFIKHKTGDYFRPIKNNTWPSIILLSRQPPGGYENWLYDLYADITPSEFKRQKIHVFKLKEKLEEDDIIVNPEDFPLFCP